MCVLLLRHLPVCSRPVCTVQVVFFAFACFIPAMHLALLMVLWVAPMSLKEHRHFFVASEVLGAWSSLDVFTVSIVVRSSKQARGVVSGAQRGWPLNSMHG